MEQDTRTSHANCCEATLSIGAMSLGGNRDAESCIENVAEVLQATARHFSRAASNSGVDTLVEKANDAEIHEQLQEILTGHFQKFGLNSLQSVLVYVLLNYFLVKKENREFESAKRLYEDHIALLKERNSDLSLKSRRESASTSDSSETQECRSCEELQQRVDGLSAQLAKLKRSYHEICHINEQWSLDYEALAKNISNATGFHSVVSTTSTTAATATTTSGSSSATSSSTHSPRARYSPDPACVRCSIYETQLEDKQQEVEDLRAIIVGLREDIKEGKDRLGLKQKELNNLESEYQIMRLQVQEIGDLQQALNMKQDYMRMQRSLQHKTKLYQDAMSEKLELQKQIEKLRQSFQKFFPSPAPSQPHPPHAAPMTSSSASSVRPLAPPMGGGFYSFPMHSCRHNIQSRPLDRNPPTPPGLLARGDLRGANVEKDEQQQLQQSRLPMMRLDASQTNSSSAENHAPLLSTGQNLMSLRTTSASENSEPMTFSRISHSAQPNSGSELVLLQAHQNGNQNGPMVRRWSHSNTSTVAAPTTNFPTNPGKMHAPPNSVSSASTFSSLGYISDDRHTMSLSDPSHSRDHTHNHTLSSVGPNSSQRSKSSLGAYSSLSSGSGVGVGGVSYYSNEKDYMVAPYIPKSRSHENLGGEIGSNQVQSSSVPPRPTSLGLSLTTTGGVDVTSSSQLSQQAIQCPNCRKTFTYTRGENEAFGPWFEHIKFCTA